MSRDGAEKEEVAPIGVDSLRVFLIGIGILLGLVASLAAMVGFYSWKTPARNFEPVETFPAPNVLERQGLEREELFAEQRRGLRDAAVPIAEAMALIVRRGQSAYSPLPQEQQGQPQKAGAEAPSAGPRPGVGAQIRGKHFQRRSRGLR